MLELVAANEVLFPAGRHTWQDLGGSNRGIAWRDLCSACEHPVAAVVDDALDAFVMVAQLFLAGLDGLILPRERLSPSIDEVLDANGYAVLDCTRGTISRPRAGKARVPGRVSLLTSGTTAVPKLVAHRWETLSTGARASGMHPRRWLLPYQIGTYAWYQLVTLGMFGRSQTLVPASGRDVLSDFELARGFGCDSVSSTPTYWRFALLTVPRELICSLQFSTITLGGERVDQALLDSLSALFPTARISHVYASSEAGACIVVKDRRSGFPLSMLERPSSTGARLRIRESRLQVQSPLTSHASMGRPDEWVDTGDLVEIRGDRVHFVGRSDSRFINVGGAKVMPADVEAVLLQHPAVAWCRVRGVQAPLVGELPLAEVVLNPSLPAASEADLTQYCSARLPEHAVPRFWSFQRAIPMNPSLKSLE